jgi:hypothetical protein
MLFGVLGRSPAITDDSIPQVRQSLEQRPQGRRNELGIELIERKSALRRRR